MFGPGMFTKRSVPHAVRIVLILCSSVALAQQPAALLYDPQKPTPAPRLSAALERQIVQDARAPKQGVRPCEAARPKILFRASGSFTQVKSSQTVYLVGPCPASAQGEGGSVLLVYQQGKLLDRTVARIFSGTDPDELYAVRDLNGNGLSELALKWSYGDAGTGVTWLDLLEWKKSAWTALGQLPLSHENGLDPQEPGQYNFSVYVHKGKSPVFIGLDAIHKNVPSVLTLIKTELALIPF